MSKEEGGGGHIKVPANQWATFKRGFIAAYNACMDEDFQVLQKIYAALVISVDAAKKAHPSVKPSVSRLLQELMWKREPVYDYIWRQYQQKPLYNVSVLEGDYLLPYMVELSATGDIVKLKKPAKSRLPYAKSTTTRFESDFLVVVLDNVTREVSIIFEYGNHAVESGSSTKLYSLVCQQLDKVTWTKSTGGQITCNDEYNLEAGRGPYVHRSFGLKK